MLRTSSRKEPTGAERRAQRRRWRDDERTRRSRQRDSTRARIAHDVQCAALMRERVVQRRGPHAECDGGCGGGERNRRGDRHRGRPPRPKLHDVLPFLVGAGEDALTERRRRNRAFHREGQRGGGALEPRQLAPALVAPGEMALEARKLLPVTGRPGRKELKAGEGLRPYGSKSGFVRHRRSVRTYSRGSFWTLCSVAYSSIKRFTSPSPRCRRS